MRAHVPKPMAILAVLGAIIALILVIAQAAITGARPVATSPISAGASFTAATSPPAAAAAAAESAGPSPTPTLRPFPVDRPYPSAPAVEPAADDVLPLAGRGSVPGLIDCGFGLPFTIDALENPTGAEDRTGPEYDALRDLLERYVALGAPELGPAPTALQVAHDATSAMFLVPSPALGGGFPYVPISVDLVDGAWQGSYGVDCYPQAVLPPGYEAATWRIDPAHPAPKSKTRALHILVKEHACASGRSATGRMGPAYVLASEHEITIGVMVKRRGGDCQGVPETPARLSLPEPIGDRILRDMYGHLLNESGG